MPCPSFQNKGLYSLDAIFYASNLHEKKKMLLRWWFGDIMTQKSDPFFFFKSRSIFPNFHTSNKRTNHSRWLCWTDVTCVTHNYNINNNVWRAFCVSFNIKSCSMHKMQILLYKLSQRHPKLYLGPSVVQFQLCFEEVKPFLFFSWSGCNQSPIFFFLESKMRARLSSLEDDSVFFLLFGVSWQSF